MAVTSGKELKIRYTADTSGVKKGIADVDKASSSLGSRLSSKFKSVGASMVSTGKSLSLGLTAPIAAAGVAAFRMADDYGDAAGQVQQHIKTMGVQGVVSFKGLSDAARNFSMQTGIAQTELLGASGKLVTFANVAARGTDFLNETTQAAADLSASGFGSISSASVMLGKALDNPLKGMTALTRVGVSFSDQQAKTITKLVETGHAAKAQGIILKAVQDQVGGTAKKIADPWDKAKASLQAAAITIGTSLMPVVSAVAGWVAKLAAFFQNLSPEAQRFVTIALGIAAALGPILIIGGKLFGAIGSIISGFKALSGAMQAFNAASKIAFLANPWFLLGAAIVAVAVLVITHWDTVKKFLLAVWDAIKNAAFVVWHAIDDVVMGVVKAVVAYFKIWLAVAKVVFNVIRAVAMAVWKAIAAYVKAWWAVTKAIFNVAKAVIRVAWKVIETVAKAVWKAIGVYIKAWWIAVKTVFNIAKGFITAVWNGIKAVALAVWRAIVGSVKQAWGIIKGVGQTIASFFSGIWNKVKEVAGNVWHGISDTVRGVWDGISGFIKSGVNGIISALNTLIRGINTAISGFNRLPGPDIGSIPSIPYLAKGGRIMRSGTAIVGERGPELITLPTGASVAPLTGVAAAGGAPSTIVLTLDRRRFGRGQELDYLTRGT